MASQRKRYGRTAPTFPSNFPKRSERFKEASGLSWGESIGRQQCTDSYKIRTIRRKIRQLLGLKPRQRWIETKRKWPELSAEAVDIDAKGKLRDIMSSEDISVSTMCDRIGEDRYLVL